MSAESIGLHSIEVLDCAGRIRLRYTLLLDGQVEVRYTCGARAVIEPNTGAVTHRGASVTDEIIAEARAFARSVM